MKPKLLILFVFVLSLTSFVIYTSIPNSKEIKGIKKFRPEVEAVLSTLTLASYESVFACFNAGNVKRYEWILKKKTQEGFASGNFDIMYTANVLLEFRFARCGKVIVNPFPIEKDTIKVASLKFANDFYKLVKTECINETEWKVFLEIDSKKSGCIQFHVAPQEVNDAICNMAPYEHGL